MNVHKRKFSASQFALAVVVTFFCVLTLFPIYVMLIKSFKYPRQDVLHPFAPTFPVRFANYAEAWKYIDGTLVNTFIVAFGITFGVLLICGAASYGFSLFKMPGKNVIFMFYLAILMIPGVLTLIPQYRLVGVDYNLIDTFWGVILPTVAGSIPMGTLLIRTFFDGLPRDIFEAGEVDGANGLVMFFVVALPLAMPILATQGIMTFMGAYNDYLWPSLILKSKKLKTTSIVLKNLTNTLFNETNSMCVSIAGYVIASLPMFVIFACCSKQFVKGLTSGSFKM